MSEMFSHQTRIEWTERLVENEQRIKMTTDNKDRK